MKTTTRRRAAALAAVALSASMVLGACGDDDEPEAGDRTTTTAAAGVGTATSTPEAGGDTAKACKAYVDITIAMNGEPAGDPAAFFEKTIAPLAEELDANKPEEIADSLSTMLAAVDEAKTKGFDAFGTPEFSAAQGEVDPFMFENCEFDQKLEISAKEYAFEGIPAEVKAGRVGILLTNDGKEAHEIALMKRKDGVTEDWDAILALPQEEAQAKVDFTGGGFVPRSGSQSLVVLDFTAGEYVAVCFVPVGSTIGEDGTEHEGDGPPHMVQGMRQEFTVA